MRRVFLGLGSNVDRRAAVHESVAALRAEFGEVVCSPVYECPAVGFEGPAFHNLVAQVHSDRTPADIDAAVRAIEDKLGRVREGQKISSRRIDIDLLLAGHLVMQEQRVRLPRTDVTRYAFVLKPLHDIAPEFVHPTRCQTIRTLWTQLESSGGADDLSRVTY